jgi:hypothetical protein
MATRRSIKSSASATPVGAPNKVTIRYSIEVDGETVLMEVLDTEFLERLVKEDEMTTMAASGAMGGLLKRLRCILCCTKKKGMRACFNRCMLDGKCCDYGTENCT